jgi:hypothetical protein
LSSRRTEAQRWWARLSALAILLGLPAGLLVLSQVSPDDLDGWPKLCLWARLLGRPCPGCGTTHALCSLMHGELQQALHFNRNVVVVAPLFAWLWLSEVCKLCYGRSALFQGQPSPPPTE